MIDTGLDGQSFQYGHFSRSESIDAIKEDGSLNVVTNFAKRSINLNVMYNRLYIYIIRFIKGV